MDSLVSTDWLARAMGANDLRIVDASYHLPAAGRDAAQEYAAGHIPGALFLDLATLVDKASPIDNTVPPAEQFASRMRRLGIGDGNRIVLYDNSDVRSATRAWYMLKQVFGARWVAVLDGGLGKWKAEGRTLVQGRSTPIPRHFTPQPNPARLRDKTELLESIIQPAEQLVDARSPARFSGEEKESRPDLASGHIPESRNLHYAKLYKPDGTFRSIGELAAEFTGAGIDLGRPVVTTCGSGMTACALAFALHLVGKEDVALYDGSWSEWGADPDLPKAVGPA